MLVNWWGTISIIAPIKALIMPAIQRRFVPPVTITLPAPTEIEERSQAHIEFGGSGHLRSPPVKPVPVRRKMGVPVA
jgi:hypothetical protein